MQDQIALFGNRDSNIKYSRKICEVAIYLRDQKIIREGEEDKVNKAVNLCTFLLQKSRTNTINKVYIDLISDLIDEDNLDALDDVTQLVGFTYKGKKISCKTYGQARYVNAIKNKPIVFGVGPAVTGKTYLAVALAALAFKNKQIDKIILTRPAIEAGEKLGFLPGDLTAKVDPYLRPLYDALQEMFGMETFNKLIEKGNIEVAPLAYMRGRTLSNAFIILDEAQNTTQEQMKMFLTRLGFNSKMVITGDNTQIDLKTGTKSGLDDAANILKDIEGIKIIHLTSDDVVRNPLVQKIIERYSKFNH